MMVTEMDEHFSLYVTPLNIDPENPAMPISHPSYYATYLAKRIGPYCTLGLAEDTWALNEGVIDDAAFLKQAYDIDHEREQMLFVALDKLRKGTLTCVFDGTDRIQHMFWRYFEEGHPAARGRQRPAEHAGAIEAIYRQNDELVGKVLARMGKDDLLMVVSDHGFASFRRGVNLNAWLLSKGYLALKEGGDGSAEWLRDVDWSRTRAYALGLTGMFLNLEGREAQGIVKPGEEAAQVKAEIMAALQGLRDAEGGDAGDQRGLRHREALPRPVPPERARPHHRLQRRLPHVLGRRHRRGLGAGLRGQRQGLERRPLHRPAAGARRPLREPEDRPRRPVAGGHRAHRAAPVRPGSARPHGRPAALREGVRRVSRQRHRAAALLLAAGRRAAAGGRSRERASPPSSCSASTAWTTS